MADLHKPQQPNDASLGQVSLNAPCVAPISRIDIQTHLEPITDLLEKLRLVIQSDSHLTRSASSSEEIDCIGAALLKRLLQIAPYDLFSEITLITSIYSNPSMSEAERKELLLRFDSRHYLEPHITPANKSNARETIWRFAGELENWSKLIANRSVLAPEVLSTPLWENISKLFVTPQALTADSSLSSRAIVGEALIDVSGLNRKLALDFDMTRQHLVDLQELLADEFLLSTFLAPANLDRVIDALGSYLTK